MLIFKYYRLLFNTIVCGTILINFNSYANKSLYTACTVAGTALAWGIFENYKKRKISQELQKLKNCENDQIEIAKALRNLSELEEKFKEEIELLKNDKNEQATEKKLLELIFLKIRSNEFNNNKWLDFIKGLEEKYNFCHTCSQMVGIRSNNWELSVPKTSQNYRILRENSTCILAKSDSLKVVFKKIITIIDKWKDAFELEVRLNRDYNNEYAQEIEAISSSYDKEDFASKIDLIIKSSYGGSNIEFPYIFYVDKLTKDYNIINKLLTSHHLDKYKVFNSTYSRAYSLENTISTLLKYIVTTHEYINEKKEKPESDRKNQLLAIELKEREAHIERERFRLETILQQEKNVAHRLVSKKAEIEVEKQRLEVKQKEIILEQSRIQNGKSIEEALKKNNNEWRYQYERLRNDYEASLKSRNELSEKINSLKQNTNLNTDNSEKKMKEIEEQTQILLTQIDALNNKINQAKVVINSLSIASNPPFNPDSVEGLREFCNGIQTQLNQLQRAIS